MKPGLYEQIINRQMNHELELIPEDCKHQEKVDSAEASRVLATYAASRSCLERRQRTLLVPRHRWLTAACLQVPHGNHRCLRN